jgi:ADP-dependent phosphofructokinase/glucokinase
MQHDDIIEITTKRRRMINQLPIRRIYEYEENIEVLIATKTNSKPEREGNYIISIE